MIKYGILPRVGDKVIQADYDWGKKKDGSYFIFEVVEIHSGERITCRTNDKEYINGVATGLGRSAVLPPHRSRWSNLGYAHYIPNHTWKPLSEIREELIYKIIGQ